MPISLLKLPAVANTASSPKAVRNIAAHISLTVVLPFEPVKATIFGFHFKRHAWAICPKAAKVSATTIWRASHTTTSRLTITAATPLANTSAT